MKKLLAMLNPLEIFINIFQKPAAYLRIIQKSKVTRFTIQKIYNILIVDLQRRHL